MDNINKSRHLDDSVKPATDLKKLKVIRNVDIKENPIFIVKTANTWIEEAKKKPIPRMLFGPFWFENELCILFADTNQGKSILAVQIANSITHGEPTLDLDIGVAKQRVLYFDLELSDKQFESRYSLLDRENNKFINHHRFSDNFIRAEIDPLGFVPESETYEEFLLQEIENQIAETDCKVTIVDNLTYLISDNEKAKDTAPFLRRLHIIIKKHNCSILLLTHTPKRSSHNPITRNDILGSKSFSNFIDSAFAIGESQKDSSIKYLKQVKVRAKEFDFDSENVIICQLNKKNNFTQFDFLKFGRESDHIQPVTNKDKDEVKELAFKLKEDGWSNVQIAQEIGVSEGAIRKWLKSRKNPD